MLRELGEFLGRGGDCFARMSSSGRTRSSIKGTTKISASNTSRARIPRSALSLKVAAETDKRHCVPLPRRIGDR